MRRASSFLALTCLILFLGLPSASQSPATADALANQYMQSMQTKEYAGAVSAAQQLVALNPAARNLLLLADAQSNTSALAEALATYNRALAVTMKEKPPEGQDPAIWIETLSRIWSGKGNVLLKLHRTDEAVAAYQRYAEYAANPALAYFHICEVLYKSGDTQYSLAACRKSLGVDPARADAWFPRKSLGVDPARADAWFILGAVAFVNSPLDAEGKPVISAESRQALEEYLYLAPDGHHADDAKAMLQMAAK
jgi:tetratricopeptide (TPR) repeat protein